MSELPKTLPPDSVDESREASYRPGRSFVARVVLDVFGRAGAIIGMIWVLLVGALAIFAPLIANSHPILMMDAEGTWSSPLVISLTVVDWHLLIGTLLAAVILPWRGFRMSQKMLMLTGALCLLVFALGYRHLFAYLAEIVGYLSALPGEFASRSEENTDPSVIPSLMLGAANLLLLLLVLYAGVKLLKPWKSLSAFKAIILGALAATAVVVYLAPIDPPVPDYAAYRIGLEEGTIIQAYFTVIPFSPQDTFSEDLTQYNLRPPTWTSGDTDAPRVHLMGTDNKSKDVTSGMIHACRIAMSIGFIATGISLVIGVILGGLMGFFSGWVDLFGMRLVEVFSAIPVIFLLIAIVAVFDRNIFLIMVVIGLTGWVGYAKFVRAEFLKLRQQDFVHAARACALPLRSILFRHMLPNGMAPILVSASFGVASAIILESTLSFLGLGLENEPSWGQMLAEARSIATFHWWMAIFPGMAIFLTVLAYNLIGEALRDSLDPKSAQRM